jgi:hypothetical protein
MRRTFLIAAASAAPVLLAFAAASGSQAVAAAHTGGDPSVFTTSLDPVPTNRVDAHGSASVRLDGDTAWVTVRVRGLITAPHAMHIHAKGEGECPEADDATKHNGRRSMSTTDGLGDYGPVGTSLTTRGDTSPASALAIARFPQVGTYTYTLSIKLTHDMAMAVRHENAVIVVHGIDYNGNKKYDYVLGVSDLSASLPMEATAPALCGPLDRVGDH